MHIFLSSRKNVFPVLDEISEMCLWISKLITLFSRLSTIYALFKLKTHFVKAEQERKAKAPFIWCKIAHTLECHRNTRGLLKKGFSTLPNQSNIWHFTILSKIFTPIPSFDLRSHGCWKWRNDGMAIPIVRDRQDG